MSNTNENTLEAYRLAEQRLASQFAASIAADQRAIGTSGMLIAAAAVSAALAETAAWPTTMLFGALGLVVSAFLAWHSARPAKFYAPGAKFSDLAKDIAEHQPLEQVLTELGNFHDKHINKNEALMKARALELNVAFYLSMISVLLSIGGQLWAVFCLPQPSM